MNEEEILLNDKNKKRPSKLDLVNNWKAGATYDEFFQPQFLNERSIQMRTPDSKFLTGFENPLRSHIPLEERIAQRQTGGYYLGAGLGRLGTKIGIEIAKVPGFVGGAIAAPFQESGHRWDMLVNNAWIRSLNELDEHIKEEVLPVYTPRHVQEGNIFDWIFHPAFWATEGADGAGFMASMFAPGAFLKVFRAGQAFSGLGRAVGLNISPRTGHMVSATIGNTFLESGNEAGFAGDAFEKEHKGSFIETQLFNGATIEEAEQKFQEQKSRLQRDIFFSNFAILLIPNALQTQMIWGKNINKHAKNLYDNSGKLLKEVKNPSIWTKVGRRTTDFVAGGLPEGLWEEGMQMTVEGFFSKKAEAGELTRNFFKNFTIEGLASEYLDVVTSVEGQKAMFLGQFLGGGMKSIQQGISDYKDRKTVNELLSKRTNHITEYYDIVNTNIYKEDGTIDYEKLQDKVKGAGLSSILGIKYRQAVEEGDTKAIEAIQEIAQAQLALAFSMNDNLGLDVLRSILTEEAQMEEIAEQAGESKQKIIDSIMKKATMFKEASNRFQEFLPTFASLEKLDSRYAELYESLSKKELANNKEAQTLLKTYQKFANDLLLSYLSNKHDIVRFSEELNKALKLRKEIIKDIKGPAITETETETESTIDPDNYYNAPVSSEEEVRIEAVEEDARLSKINEDIKSLKENLKKAKDLDRKFWKDASLKDSYNKAKKDSQEMAENMAKVTPERFEEVFEEIDSKKTEKELEAYLKTLKKEELENPVTEAHINKKREFFREEKRKEEEVRRQAEENAAARAAKSQASRGAPKKASTKTSAKTTNTKGIQSAQTSLNDEVDSDGNELDKSFTDSEFHKDDTPNDKEPLGGSVVISTDIKTGELLFSNLQDYLEYERTPRDKSKDIITFEFGDKMSKEVKDALDRLRKGEYKTPEGQVQKTKDLELIIREVPLKVNFTFKEGGRDRVVSSYIKSATPAIEQNPKSARMFELDDLPLRKLLIEAFIRNNNSFDNIKGKIHKQFNGFLKSDGSVNQVTDLEVFKGMTKTKILNYLKKNLFYVNEKGELINTTTYINTGIRYSVKSAGEVFLRVPKPDGSDFYMKLNTSRISSEKANVILDLLLIKSSIQSGRFKFAEGVKNPKLKDLLAYLLANQPSLAESLNSLQREIKLIEDNVDSAEATLDKLINVLVYTQNSNSRTKLFIEDDGSVRFGTLLSKVVVNKASKLLSYLYSPAKFVEALEDKDMRESFSKFLHYKRHNVLIRKNNGLMFNNNNYLEYLFGLDGGSPILTTDAPVNGPIFSGYTNIVLAHSIETPEGVSSKDNESNINVSEDYYSITEEEIPAENIVRYAQKGKAEQIYIIRGNKIFNSKMQEVFKADTVDRREIFTKYRNNKKEAEERLNPKPKQTENEIVEDGQTEQELLKLLGIPETETAEDVQVVEEGQSVDEIMKLLGDDTEKTTSSSNTVQTPSETQAQIAEIERRRQESLDKYTSATPHRNGWAISNNGDYVFHYIKPNTMAQWQLRANSENEMKAIINAKYDAEYVDAVKKGEMTKEQAIKALEEIGRKDSSAYAELAALEGTTTSSSKGVQTPSDIEAQKADIERRKQEELISKVKNILNKLGLEYLLPKSVTNIFNLDKSRTKSKAGMTAQWDSLRDAILLNEDFSLENLIHELIHSYIQREVQEDSYENSKKLSDKARRLAEKIKELNDKGNFNANVNFLISYVLQGQENIPITNYEEFATYYLTNKTVREALEKNGFGNIVKSFVKELTGLSDNQISNIIKLDLTAIESNKEINAKYNAELAALEGTTTTTSNTVQTSSGIETQKAEIERRRQEELNTLNRTTQTSKTQSLEPQGERVYYRIPEKDGSFNLDRKLLQEDSDSLNYSYYFVDSNNNVYLTNERFIARAIDSIDDYLNPIWDIENIAERINATGVEIIEPAKIDSNGRLIKKGKIRFTKSGKITYNFNQTSESETSYDKVKTEINAKYDAEVAALESKTTTTVQQIRSLFEKSDTKQKAVILKELSRASGITLNVKDLQGSLERMLESISDMNKALNSVKKICGI